MSVTRIWRRRIALMAVVGLVAGLIVVIAFGDGDVEPVAEQPEVTGAQPQPQLSGRERIAGGRVVLPVPEGWSGRSRDGVAQATSADRTVRVTASVASEREEAGRVLRASLDAVREGYEGVEVTRGEGKRVAGLRTRDAIAVARNPQGTPLRILIATAHGGGSTYLVQVFSAESAPPARLVEAQVALQALRLRD